MMKVIDAFRNNANAPKNNFSSLNWARFSNCNKISVRAYINELGVRVLGTPAVTFSVLVPVRVRIDLL
jgi:hypothetical protein